MDYNIQIHDTNGIPLGASISYSGSFSEVIDLGNDMIKKNNIPFIYIEKNSKLVAVLKLAAQKSEMLAPFNLKEPAMM